MVGNPKYKVGDVVIFDSFLFDETKKKEVTGVIEIVDDYGTFFDNSDVSYDILVKDAGYKGRGVLCKHIREDRVKEKIGEIEGSVLEEY